MILLFPHVSKQFQPRYTNQVMVDAVHGPYIAADVGVLAWQTMAQVMSTLTIITPELEYAVHTTSYPPSSSSSSYFILKSLFYSHSETRDQVGDADITSPTERDHSQSGLAPLTQPSTQRKSRYTPKQPKIPPPQRTKPPRRP